jgi:hypothetical protein
MRLRICRGPGGYAACFMIERAYNESSFQFRVLPERASIVTTSPTGTGSGQQAASGVSLSERTAHLCAEAALFMRDHVLSLVSHDLRGPLNAIHSWAYVLERKLDANDPAAQRAIVGIRSGVDQQVKLLETIVDTTRAGTRTLALVREPFALQALFSDSADEVRAGLARSRGVSVAFESGLSTEQFNGDRERLAAALWLMLTFAVEASANSAKVTLASSHYLRGDLGRTRRCCRPSSARTVRSHPGTSAARSGTDCVGAFAVQARRGGPWRHLRARRDAGRPGCDACAAHTTRHGLTARLRPFCRLSACLRRG